MQLFTNFIKSIIKKWQKPVPSQTNRPLSTAPANTKSSSRPIKRLEDPELLRLYKAMDLAG